VEAPGKDGNASMAEQVKRPNPWRTMMMTYSSAFSLTSALYGVGAQRHAPAALPPWKRSGTHCIGDWVGLRSPSLWLRIVIFRQMFCEFASPIGTEWREIRSSNTGFNLDASLPGHDAVSVRNERP
jgi:hypothetical protein